MSLDITIISPEPIKKKSTGIYARIDGQTRELTREEAIKRFPDVDPHDIIESAFETNEFWHGNITHNLTRMASNCIGYDQWTLYELLWRDEQPDLDKLEYSFLLFSCLRNLTNNPEKFKQFNPENGWGTYEQLVNFVKDFIKHLIDSPDGSVIEYSR